MRTWRKEKMLRKAAKEIWGKVEGKRNAKGVVCSSAEEECVVWVEVE